ncbi:MAG TPA: class I SAM-dependent methyltransferase [Candidatus Acidoferrales bacterium]|nr:class I SAM-dependent methyltransferase [Candidatus Acidoferrales bacterium]
MAPVEAFMGTAVGYYDEAEPGMDVQWNGLIWPQIKSLNFDIALDFAAGHGRNTAKLASLAKQLYVVDANPEAVQFLRERFSDHDQTRCSLQVIHNNGKDLRDVPSNAISLLYSFDSMVHFEKRLVESYMPEFQRVMAPGAYGFVHHSNFGRVSQDPDFRQHPAWRSNVDIDFFAQCCFRHKLLAVRQTPISWFVGEVLIEDLDCLSIIYKPSLWLGA